MLTYLINVTGDLLAVSLIIGVTFAYIDRTFAERGRLIVRIGLALGFLIAAVRAYITNTRRLVGGWKVGMYGYVAALALFVLWAALLIVFSFGKTRRLKARSVVVPAVTGLMLASYLYGALPNVYVYPFKFDTGGNGFLSTDYLFRLGGYLLGLLLCCIAALGAYHLCALAEKKNSRPLCVAAFVSLNVMYAVYHFAKLMSVLTARKIVDSVSLFKFAAASNNGAHWYTIAAFAVLTVIGAILWIRSFTAKEPYATKAEHRKQRALWRSAKRWSVCLLVCFIAGVLCATWFVKLNTVVIREAPVEEPQIVKNGAGEADELRVPLEMVADGHLHRFGYTTPDGKLTRFIVVLKQENTNNYGVGLDACEICGEAGYYENNEGQVVCKKCNVVMNRTTIGMKGGCNPIIIDYDINEAYITVPVEEMVKNQSRFN